VADEARCERGAREKLLGGHGITLQAILPTVMKGAKRAAQPKSDSFKNNVTSCCETNIPKTHF